MPRCIDAIASYLKHAYETMPRYSDEHNKSNNITDYGEIYDSLKSKSTYYCYLKVVALISEVKP